MEVLETFSMFKRLFLKHACASHETRQAAYISGLFRVDLYQFDVITLVS